jgi:hypothetical protein
MITNPMKLKPMKVKSFKASTLLNLYRFAMTCKKGGADYEMPPFLQGCTSHQDSHKLFNIITQISD